MNNMKDVIKNPFNVLLLSLTLAMIVFVYSLLQSFVHLKIETPLRNFQGGVYDINLGKDVALVAYGKYDRNVPCKLIDFKVLIKNIENGDTYILDKSTLIEAPINSGYIGKNLDIKMSLRIPRSMSPGRYTPTFNGTYYCKNGLFSDLKYENITSPTFTVRNP